MPTIMVPSCVAALTIRGPAMLGRRVLNKMEKPEKPQSRAWLTKGSSFRASTWVRASLAYSVHPVIPKASMALPMPPPKMPATAMASTICGKASSTSAIRMITVSSMPPYQPAAIPAKVPAKKVTATSATAASTEVLAPASTRERIHLPRLSQPKGNSAQGAAFMDMALVAFGLCGAKNGARMAITTRAAARTRNIRRRRRFFF